MGWEQNERSINGNNYVEQSFNSVYIQIQILY